MKHVKEAIADADVIYMEPVVQADYTQSRVEAGEEKKGLTPSNYKVTKELMRDKGKSDAIILHSLPRMDELPPDVDSTRHARYWIEAFNGVVMPSALASSIMRRRVAIRAWHCSCSRGPRSPCRGSRGHSTALHVFQWAQRVISAASSSMARCRSGDIRSWPANF